MTPLPRIHVEAVVRIKGERAKAMVTSISASGRCQLDRDLSGSSVWHEDDLTLILPRGCGLGMGADRVRV